MELRSPALGSSRNLRRVFLLAPFLLLFLSPCLRAQDDDVAEAARKERARKAASQQQQAAPHVYTEEDLKRVKILTPEDQARVEARKKLDNATPRVENAETLPSDPAQKSESLGEIARRLRKERAAQEAAEAAEPKISPFPYAMPNSSLATAMPEVLPPVVPDAAVRTKSQHLAIAQARAASHANFAPRRISPFQPRPLLSPSPAAHALPIIPEASAPVPVEFPAIANHTVVANPAVNPARPSVTVERTGMLSVRVQRGDSWWKLAGRYLGRGAQWEELRSLNHLSDEPPELLRQGITVVVPDSLAVKAAAQKPHVMVRKSDTLWGLAREHLGDGRDWSCFQVANPGVSDYRRLAIGTALVLPSPELMSSCRLHAVAPLRP